MFIEKRRAQIFLLQTNLDLEHRLKIEDFTRK
jgi:hypothetical protein